MDQELNIRPDTLNLIEKSGSGLEIIGKGLSEQAWASRSTINKWNLLGSCCMAKNTITTVKYEPLEWENHLPVIHQIES